LKVLGQLVALVGKHRITHLTFHTCRLYATAPPPGVDLDIVKVTDEARERGTWIKNCLEGDVARILGKTSRLRHLIIVCECTL
jgi:hypothetical protein